MSSNNLLESLNNIDTGDEKQISLLEKATHQGNYEEIDLLNLYKRFQFSVDQLLNIDDEIKKISKQGLSKPMINGKMGYVSFSGYKYLFQTLSWSKHKRSSNRSANRSGNGSISKSNNESINESSMHQSVDRSLNQS